MVMPLLVRTRESTSISAEMPRSTRPLGVIPTLRSIATRTPDPRAPMLTRARMGAAGVATAVSWVASAGSGAGIVVVISRGQDSRRAAADAERDLNAVHDA